MERLTPHNKYEYQGEYIMKSASAKRPNSIDMEIIKKLPR